MNNLKTSSYVCMHIKSVIFFMSFLTCSLTAQNLDFGKWNKFIESSSLIKKQEVAIGKCFFLVETKQPFFKLNSTQKEDSITRVLDATHYIMNSTNKRMLLYDELKYAPANDLWKLANISSEDKNTLQLFTVKTSNPLLLIDSLKSNGIKIVKQNQDTITIQVSLHTIMELILPLEHVIYVSNECLKPIQESLVVDLDLSINGIFKVQQLYPELSGNGQVIGVKDNLPNTSDIDLLDKVQASTIASVIVDNHATDMSTIISGKGNSGAQGLGVLPQAEVFPMDFNSLLPDDSSILETAGVTLINNSYGTSIENYYGILAEAYDKFLYDNPEILHVFSSGNSGNITSDNGLYEGIPNYSNLTGNFKMSKNVITVGALDQNNEVLFFSSKGPAYDGRIKPEIVAHSILGTSNSAALVTGTASVLQQAYYNSKSELPPASLIKAALLNGADDVGRVGVDFETGYGSLNALESLDIINAENYIVDTIENNQTKSFNVTLPENAIDLKVMLVWTDVAAQPNDNLALKNNLDLTISNNVNNFSPEVLNTNPTLENIEALSITGVDNLNPVEQIVISEPIGGDYVVSVQATNLVSSSQQYSVVYTWKNKEEFEWEYPVENSNFPYSGGNVSYVRWSSSFAKDKLAKLEVSYNDSGEWETIAENVMLDAGFYMWELPGELHAIAQLRFVIDNVNQLSDTFIISNGIDMATTLNCDDVTEIAWAPKENTNQYQVYNLQDNEMRFVGSTADTTFVFSKKEYPNPNFSVRPLLANNIESLASETVNTTFLPESCYFDFVFSFLEDENISIDVSLSSLHNIKSIEGFRINPENPNTQISFTESLDAFDFKVMDENPVDGQNTYQFKLITNSGQEYYSEETTVRYFSEQNPFLVFPNPTTLDQGIVIFSSLPQNETALFELFDLSGRLVLSETLASDVASISLNGSSFAKGLYVYRITGDSVKTEVAKKLVIQ